MKRDLSSLESEEFDLLVVGAGIVGACVAWDAALRGLRVALIDRGDFGSGTSQNSLKIVHGGLRHLQRLDLRAMREAVRERSTWLRVAPHLVEPLPVVVPDYGGARENRNLLRAAMVLNDLMSAGRNAELEPERRIPDGRRLSSAECLDLVPTLRRQGLRGGVLFHDAQMYSSERLVLEVVRAAAEAGARVANYVELLGTAQLGGGLRAHAGDVIGKGGLSIRTRFVVNAAGPWISETMARGWGDGAAPSYAAAVNLVLEDGGDRAAAARAGTTVAGGTRRLMTVPWRGRTLLGTGHYPLEAGSRSIEPDAFAARFMEEVGGALPELEIGRQRVLRVHFGRLPLRSGSTDPVGGLLRRADLVEHEQPAITVVSVKYTGGREIAERVVDRVLRRLGKSAVPCRTGVTRLPGAPSRSVTTTVAEARSTYSGVLAGDSIEHLVRVYGSAHDAVARLAIDDPALRSRVAEGSPVLNAQLVHGAREEMAMYVEDLLERRTELGPTARVSDDAREAADRVLKRG